MLDVSLIIFEHLVTVNENRINFVSSDLFLAIKKDMLCTIPEYYTVYYFNLLPVTSELSSGNANVPDLEWST